MRVCGGQGQIGPAVLRDGLFFFYKSLSSYAHIVANYLQVFITSQLSLRSSDLFRLAWRGSEVKSTPCPQYLI